MNGTDATEAQIHAAMGVLIHIARLHHRSIDRLSDASGLNRSPCMLLLRMAREGCLPSQRALADAFDISPALVARTLKRLTLQGYISREEDPQDPRRNAIAITPAGREKAEQVRSSFAAFDAEAFRGFAADEMEALVQALQRVEANLLRAESQWIENNAQAAEEGSERP